MLFSVQKKDQVMIIQQTIARYLLYRLTEKIFRKFMQRKLKKFIGIYNVIHPMQLEFRPKIQEHTYFLIWQNN